jgi:hypothetical protein
MGAEGGGTVELRLAVGEAGWAVFGELLQEGFRLEVQTGGSLADLLCGQLGVDPGYLARDVGTIFLDGHPVDDPGRAAVADGSRLSLSGSMPGLVGATLRKGSPLACFRSAISHRDRSPGATPGRGWVMVRLFNRTMDDLGRHFLSTGIVLARDPLLSFLARRDWALRRSVLAAVADGVAMGIEEFLAGRWPAKGEIVRLTLVPVAEAAAPGGAVR